MRRMKNKNGGVLDKRNETSEDKVFEKIKVEMVMRLRGISRDEAQGIVETSGKIRKSQPSVEENEPEEDRLISAKEFFLV